MLVYQAYPTLDLVAKYCVTKKKNGQICCCIEFPDLNKAFLKEEFPFSSINMLVNAIAGHTIFSFIDGLSGYNQIKCTLLML